METCAASNSLMLQCGKIGAQDRAEGAKTQKNASLNENDESHQAICRAARART
jgi:hypothetical protein